MRTLQYSWGRNVRDGLPPVLRSHTWAELVQQLSTPQTIRTDLPIKEAKFALPFWVPALFTGRRCTEGVQGCDLVSLDIDDPAPTSLAFLAEYVRGNLGGTAAFLHSTANAEPGSVRARVIFPLDRTADAAEWKMVWQFLDDLYAKDLGSRSDDHVGKPEQALFWPATSQAGFFECLEIEGDPLPVTEIVAIVRRRQEREAARAPVRPKRVTFSNSKTPMHVRAVAWLRATPGAVSGQGGHSHTFFVACKLVHFFGLDEASALDLMTQWNATCAPPWSAKELRHKVNQAFTKGNSNGIAA